MIFQKSVFFAPLWFGNYENFVELIDKTGKWNVISPNEISPRYLLPYASCIVKSSNIFTSYRFNEISNYKINDSEKQFGFTKTPEIIDIRLSCFSTGVGFVEFWIGYDDEMPESITNFSYWFKKAKSCSIVVSERAFKLYDAVSRLLPEGVDSEIFFTSGAEFKQECNSYHFMCLDEGMEAERMSNCLFWLKRSYATFFPREEIDERFDMVYKPYGNDVWAGSCEGLVNISHLLGDEEKDGYFKNNKESQMVIDNYFSYLVLLNQRYSAIKYIGLISDCSNCPNADLENINRKIVQLKTVFSFSVISDDRIVQNVYSEMFAIMQIDRLLADIQDNEAQMEILQNARLEKSERRLGKTLSVLSVLTVFSSLIDAATYFDRITWLEPISTVLSLIVTIALVTMGVFWLFFKKGK